MHIAYLVNQYPKVSHSFIRREILGIENCDLKVSRYSIRSLEGELVDEADIEENKKTKFILAEGGGKLLANAIVFSLKYPGLIFQALKLAIKMGWRSDRGLLLHLVYLIEACTLTKWLNKENVDHIHAHFGTNSTTVAMLCSALGGPTYSFTAHGPEEFDKACILGLKEKIHRSEFVVAVSSYGKSQLFRQCDHSQWHKIKIVHCGVDSAFLERKLSPAPETPQLLSLIHI